MTNCVDACEARIDSDGKVYDDTCGEMMVELPKRRYYRAMTRQLLMVDDLPQGAQALYEKDPRVTSWVGRRNKDGSISTVKSADHAENVLVNDFELESVASIPKGASAEEMRLVSLTALDGLLRQEDEVLLALLDAAVHPTHNLKVVGVPGFQTLNLAMMLLDEHEIPCANLFVPEWFVDILHLMKEAEFVPNTEAGVEAPGQEGLWGGYLAGTIRQAVNIYVCDALPHDTIWATAPACFVGSLAVREKESVSSGTACCAASRVGIGVIIDFAIVKIDMDLGVDWV